MEIINKLETDENNEIDNSKNNINYREHIEKLKKIPLLNDLIEHCQIYNMNFNINELIKNISNEFINENVINMYLTINDNKKYTKQEIYDYIKFLDYSNLDIFEYGKIVKHIEYFEYMHYLPLFENENIANNLLSTLSSDIYQIIPNNIFYNWLIKNFNSIMINNNKDGYCYRDIYGYIVYQGNYTYIYVERKIYSIINPDKKLSESDKKLREQDIINLVSRMGTFYIDSNDPSKICKAFKYIHKQFNIDLKINNNILLKSSCLNNYFKIVKYIIEQNIDNFDIDGFYIACKYGSFEVVEYLINFLKDNKLYNEYINKGLIECILSEKNLIPYMNLKKTIKLLIYNGGDLLCDNRLIIYCKKYEYYDIIKYFSKINTYIDIYTSN
mgnify:CR=1 FL=1